MRHRRLAPLACILLTALRLPAADIPAGQVGAEPPFVLGVAGLVDRGLPAASSSFPDSWSLLLVKLLSDLPPRFPEAGRLEELAALKLARTRTEAAAALYTLLDDLAAKELEPGLSPESRRAAVESARAKVEEARAALDKLSPTAEVAPKGESPQSFRATSLWKDHADGKLLTADPNAAAEAATANNLSLLICGTAEPAAGGYILIDLLLWDAELGRVALRRREFARASDPAPGDLAELIKDYVAGRPYARLEIAPSPDSAIVSVDGVRLPDGERRLYRFEPATLGLDIEAPGRVSRQELVELRPGDRKLVAPVLEAAAETRVEIQTTPPGAALFLDGMPLGAAPRDVGLAVDKGLLRAEAPDYESERIVIAPTGPSTIEFSLIEASNKGSAGRLERAKDRFYQALGWLVLGLAGRAIIRGTGEGLAAAVTAGGEEALSTRAVVAEGLSLGANLAAGLLAANAGWKLAGYIGAAR